MTNSVTGFDLEALVLCSYCEGRRPGLYLIYILRHDDVAATSAEGLNGLCARGQIKAETFVRDRHLLEDLLWRDLKSVTMAGVEKTMSIPVWLERDLQRREYISLLNVRKTLESRFLNVVDDIASRTALAVCDWVFFCLFSFSARLRHWMNTASFLCTCSSKQV